MGVRGIVLRGSVLELVCERRGAYVGFGRRWRALGRSGSFGRVGALVGTGVLGQVGVGGCWLWIVSGRWVSETTDPGSGH